MLSPTRQNRCLRAFAVLLVGAAVAASCSSSDDAAVSTDAPTTASIEDNSGTDAPTGTEAAPATDAPVDTEAPIETDAPETTEPALAEFETIGAGPYDVGAQTITITDESRARPLTVEVWFPVTDAGDAAPYEYSFAGTTYPSPTARAVPADQIATDGPFPLVVFSHGSPGIRFLNSTLPEALAANGYIVVAADHTGNTVIDLFANTLSSQEQNAVDRPLDVQTMITAMTDPTDPETAVYAAQVDPEHIAVSGHSVGGYTTYATVSGVSNAIATVPPDPRVGAIITLAPASGGVTDEMFAAITVPALVMAGTDDEATPIDPNVTRAWELSASEPHYRADFVGATHQSFADFCEYQAYLATVPDVAPLIIDTINERGVLSCAPEAMTSTRTHELTATFAVAFLDSIFRGGTMIDETNTTMPDDVEFQTK